MPFVCQNSSCHRSFTTLSGLRMHGRAKSHAVAACDSCERVFVNKQALQQHMNSSIHVYDSSDETDSDDEDSADESIALTECPQCWMEFTSEWLVYRHLAENHHWCFLCSKGFHNASSLENHYNSSLHSDRSFDCPFCSNPFKSPSAIAMHIESGCHKINRHQVTAAVQTLSIIPQITVKQIAGPVSLPSELVTYIATEQSFNGREYECFICHSTFRSLDALNRHLNSPAHDADEFKCPKCNKKFKLISGLMQHIESGTCGIAKFKTVANHFDSLAATFSKVLTF